VTFPFPIFPPFSPSQALVSDAAGTAIGNMTAGGGLAGAFNGSQDQANAGAGAAYRANADTAFVGKDWGSGNTKTISKADVWGAAAGGTQGSGFAESRTTVTLELRGDNSAPTTGTEGTLLASSGSFSDDTAQHTLTVSSLIPFRYVWIYISLSGGSLGNAICGELDLYETV
jgi:hypothetical protein